MEKQLDESGLNIIENPDGSFAFEWDPKDERWSWLNDLTDDQIKTIIEEMIDNPKFLETIIDEYQQSLGSDERS